MTTTDHPQKRLLSTRAAREAARLSVAALRSLAGAALLVFLNGYRRRPDRVPTP